MRFKALKSSSLVPRTGGAAKYTLLTALVAVLAVLAAAGWLMAASDARAQTVLVLADWDDSGREAETLALVEATSDVEGTAWHVLFTSDGNNGTLIDGELTVGMAPTEASITRVRYRSSNSRLNFLVATGLNLQTYFGPSGDGADLDITVQTLDGAHTWRPVIEGNTSLTANINFDTSAEVQAIVEGIDTGERFILAFSRETAATPGSATLTPTPADERIKVGNVVEFTTNAPTGIANWTVTETQGTGDATLHTSSSVDCTTQSNTISVGAGSSFWVGHCTAGTTSIGVEDSADRNDVVGFAYTILPANTAPAFDSSTYTLSVSEDATGGTDVGAALTATDGDSNADDLTFTALTGDANFVIDEGSGQISLAASPSLDYEDTTRHTLTAQVSDTEGNPHGGHLTGTATITVNVTDVDERPQLVPAPGSVTHEEHNNQEYSFANVGTIQNITVTATDITGDITLRTTESGLDCQTQTHEVSVASSSTFWARHCGPGSVSLEVADAADASNSRSYSFVVTDVNEAPAFDAETGTRNVDENLLVGANVGAPVVATDPEDDTLTYATVSPATTGGFTVVNGSGQIQTGQKLNHEVAGSHLVRIQVSDSSGLTDTIDVTVTVNDVAEAPVFTDALSVTLEVAENSAAGVNVGDPVTAVDEDAGDTVSYSDDSSEFDINSSTGQVQVATGADLDYEGTDQYVFTATATDSTGLTDTIEVTVDITDVDERPTLVPDPTTISTGMGTNQQFSFGNVGSIQTISVSRQDNGGSIVVHTGQAGLDCASSVGGVSVASSSSFWVRYCTGGEVSLIVRDVGNPTTNFRVYTFSVAESNVAPVFDIPGQFGRTIPENSAAGTNVGDAVTATDADDGQTVS